MNLNSINKYNLHKFSWFLKIKQVNIISKFSYNYYIIKEIM